MAQNHVEPGRSCLGTDSVCDSEDTQCILDRIERRLSALERVLWALCQQRQYSQSIRKRRTTFDYVEFWLSTTVHQTTCTLEEEKAAHFATDLAKGDAMAD